MDGQRRTRRSAGDDDGSIPAGQGAEVVRALITAGGRSLRSLARRTDWSFQSWSAYQTGDRPVPVSALRQLLTVTGVATDSDLGRRATDLLTAYQSAPGTPAANQLSDSATKPSDHAGPRDLPVDQAADDAADETMQIAYVAGQSGHSRRRSAAQVARWASGIAIAAVIAVFVAPVLSDDRETAPDSSAASTKKDAPCWRTSSTAPATPSAPTAPAAQVPSRLTAYAPGGAGYAELFAEQRHIAVVDESRDGCSVILTALVDGVQVGPWANAEGKTGKLRNGTPIPPKIVDLPWWDTVRRLEFRACFGEVINKRPIFREPDCGAWVTVNR